MTIFTTVIEAVERQPYGDTEAIASAIYKDCTKRDLFPLLVDEVRHRQRAAGRAIEEKQIEAFLEKHRASGTLTPIVPAADESVAFLFSTLDQTFRLGDGTPPVSWGAATLDQHRQRAALLTRMRNGLNASIGRHEAAIDLLERTGVACLNDVADTEAA